MAKVAVEPIRRVLVAARDNGLLVIHTCGRLDMGIGDRRAALPVPVL